MATAAAPATLLSLNPLFTHLDPEACLRIEERATLRRFAPGEVVVREGDYGHTMYLIVSGAAQVYSRGHAGQEVVLARLEAGDAFGEQALLSGTARRNASVRAFDPVMALELTGDLVLGAIAADAELAGRIRLEGEDQRRQRREAI